MLDDINLAQLLDQIGAAQAMPLAIKDLTHRFVYVNAPFCDSVGYSAEELIGNDDLDIGRPDELVLGDPVSGWAGLWSLDNQAIKEKKLTISTEAGPGRHSSTEIVRIPLFNDRGEVSALLIQLFDVTEVKDLKQRIATNVNALSMREGEISTMDSVLASLMACQDTNTLLEQLSTILVERTRADCCYAATLHESGEFMEIVAASGNHSSEYLGGQFRRREGTIGRAWHRGEAIYISDVSTIQSIHEWPVHTQAFSLPLFVDNEAVAALTVISDPVSKDLEAEIPMLQRICGIASMAIANTRLIDTTQQRLKATRALAEVSQILTSVDDIAEACNLVCRILLPALDAKRASIFVLNDDDDLNSLVSWGYSQGSINRAIALSSEQVRQCIAQWCVDNDQIATIGRLDEDPRESELIHSLRAEMNLGSTCCIPLKKQGRVFGAMLLLRTRDMRVFSEAHIDMFQAMVNQLSMSIDRIELARELQHQAFHDRLTGLANRHRFEQILDDVIDDAKNANRQFCVLFIDLDGFKEVNDTHGHAVGDRLLSMVAVRLSSRLDSQSTLARMGGDEFAVILYDDCMGTDQANALKDSLQSNFVIDGEILNIGASIGIGRYPENGVTANMLLQTADHAMYQAKRIGKGCVCLYNETLAVATRDRSLLETQLRDAIEKQQFHLLYQPQVRSSDSRVIGLEALIRWSHPARGLLPPAEFIPLAESSGLINQIGRWVINESVRQLASWQNTSIDSVRVSINIAAPQFQQEDFCDQIIGALQRHSLAPELLELEVTESVLMDDVEIVVSRLQKLREAGVRIAIDDFGTGYSSLSYLQDLPLDTLKIDRTFVNRLGRQSTRESLIHTIQTLATSLGLETVAEGVELPDQLEQIRHLGCDLVQGFLFSRPVPAHDIPAIVESIQHHTRAKVPLRQVK